MSQVTGFVAPGFEPVRELFESNFRRGYDKNSQLSVYFEGEHVVDLCAATSPCFGPDSVVNIFSSTKCLTSIVVAKMVDEGRISYETKISSVWPEFAANDKGHLTVADLMRHEAGLSAFDETIQVEDLLTERIKENAVAPIIEKQILSYRDGGDFNRREYHAFTRGWIANEIVRRVDAKGRTIGEILREEISGPMNLNAFIGLNEEEMKMSHPIEPIKDWHMILQGFLPQFMGRKTEFNIFELMRLKKANEMFFENTSRKNVPAPVSGFLWDTDKYNLSEFFNLDSSKKSEIPSANGHASARALSVLGSLMANGGVFGDFRLLSDETLADFHADPIERDMGGFVNFFNRGGAYPMTMSTKASADEKKLLSGMEGYVGWIGYGGSVFAWHPEQKIGFGFVPAYLNWIDVANQRGMKLQKEVLRCARQRKEKS